MTDGHKDVVLEELSGPGISGGSDVPRVARSRFAGLLVTTSAEGAGCGQDYQDWTRTGAWWTVRSVTDADSQPCHLPERAKFRPPHNRHGRSWRTRCFLSAGKTGLDDGVLLLPDLLDEFSCHRIVWCTVEFERGERLALGEQEDRDPLGSIW